MDKNKKSNICIRRTRNAICIILGFGVIVSVVVLNEFYQAYRFSTNSTTILTEDEATVLYKSLLEIEEFVDPEIDPCEDFHQFACGKFIESSYAKQIINPIQSEQNYIHNELNSYLVGPISKKDFKPVTLQKNFFQSCLDTDAIDSESDQILFTLLEDIGGWPLRKQASWLEKNFNWISVLEKCKELGLPFQWFLKFGLYTDEGINYLQLSSPVTFNVTRQYENFLTEVAQARSISKSSAKTQISKVLQFARKLNNISISNESPTSIESIEKLQGLDAMPVWIDLLNNLTMDSSYEFTENVTVVHNLKTYLPALNRLLMETPKRIQANYIIYKIIEELAPFLSSKIRKAYGKYSKQDQLTRGDVCQKNTLKHFSLVSESQYVRKYYDPKSRNSAMDMTSRIYAKFLDDLRKVEWIKNDTRAKYVETYEAAEIVVGGTEEMFDESLFDQNILHIGNLTFSPNSTMMEMVTERCRTYYESMFAAIGKPGIDPETVQWYSSIRNLGVRFNLNQNKLSIAFPNLHGFLYNHHRPKYLNYGSLGTLIGEELVRTFLNQLNIDDKHSKIWTHADYKVFDNGTECFENDFSRNLQDKPTKTGPGIVKAAISDVVGRNLAYVTYQEWVQANKEESPLLSLKYSPNQLFWIKSSLFNCYNSMENIENLTYPTILKTKNIMSPRHSEYFFKDFKCKVGSKMNPVRKCWSFL